MKHAAELAGHSFLTRGDVGGDAWFIGPIARVRSAFSCFTPIAARPTAKSAPRSPRRATKASSSRVLRLRRRLDSRQALLAHIADAVGSLFDQHLDASWQIAKSCGADNEQVEETGGLKAQLADRTMRPLLFEGSVVLAANIDLIQDSGDRVESRPVLMS
jgi:hypothetical protein